MSEEHASTDGRGGPIKGDGVTADELPPVPDEQTMTAAELDSLFELLANRQRRRVLGYLVDAADGVATFPDIIDHVVAESGDSTDDERVAINLHHTHLPKLEAENVVEYDDRSETVRYRGSSAVTEWVEFARR